MKVVFVNDKVQAKVILDNMDVHNFAVNLFCQSWNWPNCSLHSIMFVISNKNHLITTHLYGLLLGLPGTPVFFCLYSNATCSN